MRTSERRGHGWSPAPVTRRGALAALGAFGLSLTGADVWRAFPERPQVSRHRGQCRAAARAQRRPDRSLDGAGARVSFARSLGPRPQPGDKGAPVLEVRVDWILLGPSSGGTGPRRLLAGYDRRKLHRSGTARRNRMGSTVAGDFVLLPDQGVAQALVERAYHGRVVDSTPRPSPAAWGELGL